MRKRQKRLVQDFFLLAVSVGFAAFLAWSGLAERLIASLDGLSWLGMVVAGMFFTSVFTTAPAIVVLGTFAETNALPALVILGAAGAMLGDYLIFRLVEDRLAADLGYLLSISKHQRLRHIFKTRFFRFFVPFLGALVIASPLPDELGVAMLGLSKVRTRVFLLLSFVFNGLGILAIGWTAQTLLYSV